MAAVCSAVTLTEGLRQHRRQLERPLQAAIGRPDSLVAAIEGGEAETFGSVAERMEELKGEGTQLEDELVSTHFETSRIEEALLSAEAMTRPFTTFADTVGAATPEQLGEMVPLVVKVIERTEGTENPGSGHRGVLPKRPWRCGAGGWARPVTVSS